MLTIEEKRARGRAYTRKWLAEHPDYVRPPRKSRGKYNKERALAYARLYAKRFPERVRAGQLRRDYGLTVAQYDKLFRSQAGRCAICGTDQFGGHGKKPHVDHCHVTGKVRGLLCHNCNLGIGGLRDDPTIVRKALDYLLMFADAPL